VVFVLKKIPVAPLSVGPHIVKVAKKSDVARMAGSIAHTVRKQEGVTMQAFGAECIALAVDALVVSRRMLKEDNLDICFVPQFIVVDASQQIGEKKPTAVQFHLYAGKR